ncbi:disulfide reductase [bacterium]|nr:disulfide reductase [bacterium]
MSYLYYPGCSLKSTGVGYEESILNVFQALDIPFPEVDDWNCCGATAYMAVDELKAYALASRNLALAEKMKPEEEETIDVIAPCAACFLVLYKTEQFLNKGNGKSEQIHDALKEAGLSYTGKARVRHPLDVLVNDIGLDRIKEKAVKPLKGLKVASYYGCQILRPYAPFDNMDNPRTMDDIMVALGAEAVDWPLKTRCCGASLAGTVEDVGRRLSYIIVKEAEKRGADVLVTACPLCQHNLECYQDRMRKEYKDDINFPVAYFSQLMGMAFGIEQDKLGLQRLFIPFEPALAAE